MAFFSGKTFIFYGHVSYVLAKSFCINLSIHGCFSLCGLGTSTDIAPESSGVFLPHDQLELLTSRNIVWLKEKKTFKNTYGSWSKGAIWRSFPRCNLTFPFAAVPIHCEKETSLISKFTQWKEISSPKHNKIKGYVIMEQNGQYPSINTSRFIDKKA